MSDVYVLLMTRWDYTGPVAVYEDGEAAYAEAGRLSTGLAQAHILNLLGAKTSYRVEKVRLVEKESKVYCDHCHKREATKLWAKDGIMSLIHGFKENWCEYCVIEAQLHFAREQASRISQLEQRFEELKRRDNEHD